MEYQTHYDKKFYKDLKTGYWISVQCPKIRAHRWVWQNVHGKIPEGYHIHHKDEDKSNNCIDNLELIEGSRHLSIHASKEESKTHARKMANKYRHLTKEWHASEQGIAWHRMHGIKTWLEKKPIEITCKHCGKISETKTYHQEFCSNSCKSAWRRQSGIDDIEIQCMGCKKEFKKNKYSKVKYCSRACYR